MTLEDWISPSAVDRLAATLGVARAPARRGDVLPLGWHWIFCTPAPLPDGLAEDGLPADDPLFALLPDLPHRVFGGTQMQQHAPLRVGEALECRAHVEGIARKQGRSGPLAVVRVVRAYWSEGRLALEERQEVIHTAASTSAAAPAVPRTTEAPAPHDASAADPESLTAHVPCDTVRVFRFSALMFNSHRVHYDLPYTQAQEGRPALLVQAKLSALLALDLARQRLRARPTRVRYRAVRPLHAPGVITLHAQRAREGEGLDLSVRDAQGHECLVAHAA